MRFQNLIFIQFKYNLFLKMKILFHTPQIDVRVHMSHKLVDLGQTAEEVGVVISAR